MKQKAVEIHNVGFSYNGTPTLTEINLSIDAREFIGIIGPNGGGKTTLLKLMLGQITPDTGEISIFSKTPARARSLIGYMPQHSIVNNNMPISVEEIVAMGLFKESNLWPKIGSSKKEKINDVLRSVSMHSMKEKLFHELSGGQKQRTLLARAIVSSPKLLLLDEPTASVDFRVEQDIYDYLKVLAKEMTVILVSHDVSVISTLVDKVICLNQKAAIHPVEEITSETMVNSLYTRDYNIIHHKCNL